MSRALRALGGQDGGGARFSVRKGLHAKLFSRKVILGLVSRSGIRILISPTRTKRPAMTAAKTRRPRSKTITLTVQGVKMTVKCGISMSVALDRAQAVAAGFDERGYNNSAQWVEIQAALVECAREREIHSVAVCAPTRQGAGWRSGRVALLDVFGEFASEFVGADGVPFVVAGKWAA